MNARTIVKFAANALVGIGAYGITRTVIDNNTNESQSKTEEVLHYAGSVGIAGVVADAASDRIDTLVDGLFNSIDQFKSSTH